MPFFCRCLNSSWQSFRKIISLKKSKQLEQKTSKTITIKDPMTLEKTSEIYPLIIETRNKSCTQMLEKSNPINLESTTESPLDVLKMTTFEFDPIVTCNIDKPSPEMLARGYDVSDRLYRLEKEINHLKAKKSELITNLSEVNRENRILSPLSGK